MPGNIRTPLSTQIQQRYTNDPMFHDAVEHIRYLLKTFSVTAVASAVALATVLEAEATEETPDAD